MSKISIHRPHIQNQNAIKKNNSSKGYEFIPEDHKKFAKAMESQFAELMLKEMQKSVGNKDTNQAQQIYESMLLKERAKNMADNKDSAIQELILNEVYPQKFRNEQNFEMYQASQNKFKKNKVAMHDHHINEYNKVQKHKSVNSNQIHTNNGE